MSFLITLLLLFGVALIWFIIVMIAFPGLFDGFVANHIHGRLIERVSFLISFVLAWFIAVKKGYLYKGQNSVNWRHKIARCLEASIVIGGSVVAAFWITNLLGLLMIDPDSKVLNDIRSVLYQFFVIGIVNNLMVSLGEEMVYRGIIFVYILRKTQNLHASVIISSLVFALMHAHYSQPISFILVFVAGGIFAFAYHYSKTLLVPVGMHFSYNFFMEIFKSEEQDYLIKILETDIVYISSLGDAFAVIRLLFMFIVGVYVVMRFGKSSKKTLPT